MRNQIGLAAIALAAACSNSPDPTEPVRPVEFKAESQIVEDGARALRVALTATNVTSEAVTLEWGECAGEPVRVRAYTGSSSEPAWDALDTESFCLAVGLYRTLAGGESASFVLRIPVSAILDDDLAPGEYEITVTPNFLNVDDGPELKTGKFELLPS